MWGGGSLLNTKNNNTYQKYKNLIFSSTNSISKNSFLNLKYAFSLIELSIVLIIIGLLVAGITGGASLIQSAKTRALINEIEGYKRAVYTFRVAKDRLPGDLRGTGRIGWDSDQNYVAGDFPAPYDGSSNEHGIPKTDAVGPFVDLYLAGIIDFEPKNTGIDYVKYTEDVAKEGAAPYSKNNGMHIFYHSNTNGESNKIFINEKNSIYNLPLTTILQFLNPDNNKRIQPKMVKAIDVKMDDSIYNQGNIRGRCGNDLHYDEAIETKQKCSRINYAIGI